MPFPVEYGKIESEGEIMKKYRFISIIIATLILVNLAVSCDKSGSTVKPPAESQNTSSEDEYGGLPPFVDDDIDDIYNLALKATAFASSVSLDYPTLTADKLNDGDMLTRWKSELLGTEEEPSSFGLAWEEEQVFDVIIICWEAHHPAENGFEITLSPDSGANLFIPESLESVEQVTDEVTSEEKITYRIYRRDTEADDGQRDIIIFSSPVSVNKLTVTCTEPYSALESENVKDRPSCYEISVYNSIDIQNGSVSATDEDIAEFILN